VDVAIVGAGAAGLATAIFAAQHDPGLRVALLDGAKIPGAKILVAGGGRCNVTNRVVTAADFSGGSRNAIKKVLAAFPVDRTIAWFAEMGVPMHEEEHGKLFPDSNQARTVLNALLSEARQRGVMLLAAHRVAGIERDSDAGFRLTTSAGGIRAGRVVLATGGMSLAKTGSDGAGYELARHLGHSFIPTVPALVPLVLDGEFHKDLSGIAQDVELTIAPEGDKPTRMSGALLWTHFGISGPVVLDASRHWTRARLEGESCTITANLLPGDDLASAEDKVLDLVARQPRTILRNAMGSWLPARVADAVLAELHIDGRVPLAHLGKDIRRRLLQRLLAWPLPVLDSRGYNHAEVTAGGIPLDEIDPATMQSRRCPGLYLVGEILDVDGRIGGFNFQWSWAGGHVAGRAIARSRGPTDL
jgi:predicted Rossmann fold flavoprotein